MQNSTEFQGRPKAPHPAWMKDIRVFEKPSLRKATFQIIDTLLPLIALWGLMIYSVLSEWSYLVTLAFMVPASLLLVRIFIFFHDCTHGSYFKSQKANTFWGFLFGILTFTPYDDWRQSHGIHHNTSGDLDLRGVGDVWTMTVEEYQKSGRWKRFFYRLYRNPFILFLVIPPLLFVILHRIPHKGAKGREVMSTMITNLGLLILLSSMVLAFGWKALLLVHLPMFYLASIVGVWLFYIQHQFDPGYWERHSEWDHLDASLQGSSHYKLPKILQWFSGNIGLHHIHHVRPRIPNYNLQACYDQTPELQLPNPLTFGASFKSLHKHLWDEVNKRLLSFRQATRIFRRLSAEKNL